MRQAHAMADSCFSRRRPTCVCTLSTLDIHIYMASYTVIQASVSIYFAFVRTILVKLLRSFICTFFEQRMPLLSSSHKVIFVDDLCHGMVDLVDFKIESAASFACREYSKSIIGLVLISFHFIETLSDPRNLSILMD